MIRASVAGRRSHLRVLPLLALLLFVVGAPPAKAQAQGPQLKEGIRALVAFPAASFKADTHFSGWSPSASKTSLDAVVEASGQDGVTVNGNPDWRLSGFPSFLEIEVKKIKYDSGKRRTRVDVKSPLSTEVRIFLVGEASAAQKLFAAITIVPSDRPAYLDRLYADLAKHFFSGGPLADLPEGKQVALVRFVHATAPTATLGTAVYKEKLYLAVRIAGADTVYNDLKLNQAQRVATVLNDGLLVALKGFAEVVAGVEPIHGLKLEVSIPHRPFTQDGPAQIDAVEIYAPTAEIKRFADADITSQGLIDKSVIVVNSNRTEVRLSDS